MGKIRNVSESYHHPLLALRRTEEKGLGVFATGTILQGECAGIEAGGALYSTRAARELRAKIGDYSHQIGEVTHWGPKNRGDICLLDRMNHGCEPNVGFQGDMTFVALRDIKPGEEVVWDYAMSESDPAYGFECRCGAITCRGKMTGQDWMQLGLQIKYYGSFVPYLQKLVEACLEENHYEVRGNELFFKDKFDRDAFYSHRVRRERANVRSMHQQHIQIIDTQYGTCLALDGYPQIAATDCEYTESLVSPGILLLGQQSKRVLILGGGDGAALAQVLRDPTVTEAWLVDIDMQVITLTQQHMPQLWEGVYRDPRMFIVICDALTFLKQCLAQSKRFDIIISDLTDPEESALASPLMCDDYFSLIRKCLADDGGILAMQAGQLTRYRHTGHKLVRALIQKQFPNVISASVHVPWFSTNWGFVFASSSGRITGLPDYNYVKKLFSKARPDFVRSLRFLTPESLIGNFSIPEELHQKISA